MPAPPTNEEPRKMVSSTLREYLTDGQSHLVVGVHDVLTAQVAVASQFEILYVGGYGTAAGVFGLPDLGLTTMTEMVDTCSRICDAVDRPVLVDADTGYGNELNTRRAVRAFERSGAGGLHLEDQRFPKRCGHLVGKTLISCTDMCQKIKVALDARHDDQFVVAARSDAIAVEGIDDAIRRGAAYHEAGADVLFIDAPETLEQAERIARELPGPLVFDWSYDGVTPPIPRQTLEALGYTLILFPDTVSAIHRGLTRFLSRLRETDSLTELANDLTPFDDLNAFVGMQAWLDLAGDERAR
jgi:2-methylisocitrate lyase-like PEP mutase family enzyme